MQGRAISATAPTTGQVLTWSGTQWSAQAPTGGVTSTFGRTGAVAAQTGDYSFGQISGTVGAGQLPALGGDLSGLVTSATVSRIQNRAVSATAPTTGQALMWDGTQWGPSVPGGVNSMFGRIGAVTGNCRQRAGT
jgi:hypothetical protein